MKIVYWQRSDRTRKVLEVVNRKWLSKSRWSMLTAGTKQEIAERLNGCKKKSSLAQPLAVAVCPLLLLPVLLHRPYLPKLQSLAVSKHLLLEQCARLQFQNQCWRLGRQGLCSAWEAEEKRGLTNSARDGSGAPSACQRLRGLQQCLWLQPQVPWSQGYLV